MGKKALEELVFHDDFMFAAYIPAPCDRWP